MNNKKLASGQARVAALSGLTAPAAPLVLIGIILGRKAERRLSAVARHWTKRMQHEIARWT